MKSGIHFALIAVLASSAVSAAEISAGECAAIRDLVQVLAEQNLEASKGQLAAQKAVMGLVADTFEAPDLRAKLMQISDSLKTKEMEKTALVSGLTTLNKVCPK